MSRKKKRKTSLRKVRMFFAVLVFGGITMVLSYNFLSNLSMISKMTAEKRELKAKIVDLKEEKKELETDIMKLEDPDYIAKYVREKYFYSKEGELILRIDD